MLRPIPHTCPNILSLLVYLLPTLYSDMILKRFKFY